MSAIDSLKKKIGYHFNDSSLLETALTHRSFGAKNNERLEFLGDAVLGAVIARALFERFTDAKEGELTRMRARLVRGETLAVIAHELEFEKYLIVGAGELKAGGRQRSSIRADAFEAVMGGIYLDDGFETVSNVILALFEERLSSVQPDIDKDSKTQLQEALQQKGLPLPEYAIISKSGKPHDLSFEVQCKLSEPDRSFVAKAKSRRAAEQQAAKDALEAL
jgi:ribonuclease-3